MRVGAVDIGSNSIRLLVAETVAGENGGALVSVARAGEACRLGRGLDRTGRVQPELAERAAVLASEFVRRARALGAVHVVVGATAALRRAANGAEVASAVGERCGVPVRILTGDDEARLVYRSVVLGLGRAARRGSCVVFDLGGGSTEVVSGAGEEAGRWASLHFGAVSLTERHLHSVPPTPAEVAALEEDVRERLMHHCALMPRETPILAGVGGTITALASLDRGLSAYDPTQIEGWCVLAPRLSALVDRLVSAPPAEKRRWPVMGEGRADIVAAGALAVRVIAERFPSPGLVCSTQGLRYGLARLAAQEAGDGTGEVQR